MIVTSFNTNLLDLQLSKRMKKTDGEYPSVWIADTTTKLVRYKLKSEVNRSSILEFYNHFVQKLLIPEIISESEDSVYYLKGHIPKLVATNFNKNVYENEDDVLVYFYNGKDELSCYMIVEMLELVYNRDFNSERVLGLRFYKIDMLNNEIEDVDVDPYLNIPQLKLFGKKKGKKKPVDFHEQGFNDFMPEEFKKFINKFGDFTRLE